MACTLPALARAARIILTHNTNAPYDVYAADAAHNYLAGNVGIATATPTPELTVIGTVGAKEVIVTSARAQPHGKFIGDAVSEHRTH